LTQLNDDVIVANKDLLFCPKDGNERLPMSASISLPFSADSSSDFGCEVKLTGLLPRTTTVHGTDSLQAVSLALFSVTNHLRMLESMGTLYYPDGDKYSVDEDFAFIRRLSEMSMPPQG